MRARSHILLAVALVAVSASQTARAADDAVDFARDVQPVLSDRCYRCHGPDETTRKGKLRLDLATDALRDRQGYAVVVSGDPDASELVARIEADDDTKMPPAKSDKSLTTAEIAMLRRWVSQGAKWQSHWSFSTLARPPVANAPNAPVGWPRNAIDLFVLDRLRREGLAPAPEAPRHTLIRRVSLDLTGMPPTPEEVAAFLADTRPDAHERLVDRILASPRVGERLAFDWLDAARYSDTDGFQGDETRANWPWRDWVIDALNANMPFDRFTREQFAGDLLPNATPDQILATCFHRNHMTNGEGGRDPEESRIDYVIDRVNTFGTLWLGLTLGCCQCHSHKYDPVSQADFYKLNAFFNSIDEDGKAGRNAKPYLPHVSTAAARAAAEAKERLAQREAALASTRAAARPGFERWLAERLADPELATFRAWTPLRASRLASVHGSVLARDDAGVVAVAPGPDPRHEDDRVIGPAPPGRITAFRLEVFPDPLAGGKLSRSESGHFILTDIKVQLRRPDGSQVREVVMARALADYAADPKKFGGYGAVKDTLDDDPRNGWSSLGSDPTQPRVAVFIPAEPIIPAPGEELILELRHRSTVGFQNIARFRVSTTSLPGPDDWALARSPIEELADARVGDASRLDAKLRERLFNHHLEDDAAFLEARAARDRAAKHLAEMNAARKVDVMVLAERKTPRETHVLVRGAWDNKGERVDVDVPSAIAPWPEGSPRNRMGLADWLTSPTNPLTARVAANRLWQTMLGTGLVRTPEDFGRQGEPPTHPELLDWLAVEFRESGWDTKHLLRLIATSATYRQASTVSEALRARDPENRLLARGASFDCRAGRFETRPCVHLGCSSQWRGDRQCALISRRGSGKRCSWVVSSTNPARDPTSIAARSTPSGGARPRQRFCSTALSGASARCAVRARTRRSRPSLS